MKGPFASLFTIWFGSSLGMEDESESPWPPNSAKSVRKRVLVAVGAGVGVTPFISLLSTLVAELVSESKQHRLVEVEGVT